MMTESLKIAGHSFEASFSIYTTKAKEQAQACISWRIFIEHNIKTGGVPKKNSSGKT